MIDGRGQQPYWVPRIPEDMSTAPPLTRLSRPRDGGCVLIPLSSATPGEPPATAVVQPTARQPPPAEPAQSDGRLYQRVAGVPQPQLPMVSQQWPIMVPVVQYVPVMCSFQRPQLHAPPPTQYQYPPPSGYQQPPPPQSVATPPQMQIPPPMPALNPYGSYPGVSKHLLAMKSIYARSQPPVVALSPAAGWNVMSPVRRREPIEIVPPAEVQEMEEVEDSLDDGK